MKPSRDQLQHYLLTAERGPVDAQTATWARRVLEDALLRAERADRVRPSLSPSPERHAYHVR